MLSCNFTRGFCTQNILKFWYFTKYVARDCWCFSNFHLWFFSYFLVKERFAWFFILIWRDLQDRIVARLQQPYSLDCIPVEAEYQVKYSCLFIFLKLLGISIIFELIKFLWTDLRYSKLIEVDNLFCINVLIHSTVFKFFGLMF